MDGDHVLKTRRFPLKNAASAYAEPAQDVRMQMDAPWHDYAKPILGKPSLFYWWKPKATDSAVFGGQTHDSKARKQKTYND